MVVFNKRGGFSGESKKRVVSQKRQRLALERKRAVLEMMGYEFRKVEGHYRAYLGEGHSYGDTMREVVSIAWKFRGLV